MCGGDKKVDRDLPSLLSMNLLEFSEHKNELDIRYELSPVLCQFIEQDINKENLEKFMQDIIKYYAVVLKDVFR